VAYFAVVLARSDDGWDVNDVDLDEIDDLTDLADLMRESADEESDGPFLLFLEQEDLWFAVVRVDGEDDPRVFVSDRQAVVHSAYAEMLLEAAGDKVDLGDVDDVLPVVDDEDSEGEDDDEGGPKAEDSGPVGDHDLLADLGTNANQLVDLCTKEGMLPSEVLTYLAEQAGAAEALESVR
jgi:putative tRNA adenosine deaminase-associated protein